MGRLDLGSWLLFVFPLHNKTSDCRWLHKMMRQIEGCTTLCFRLLWVTKSIVSMTFALHQALPSNHSCFAAWRTLFYVRRTFLTICKPGSWILPCWEHGAIINVDHSIEDAGQDGGRESLWKGQALFTLGGEWARGMWAEREPCEAWVRDTIVPYSYPLSQIRVKEAWGHNSCCSARTHNTGRAALRPARSSQQIRYAHSSKPFCCQR